MTISAKYKTKLCVILLAVAILISTNSSISIAKEAKMKAVKENKLSSTYKALDLFGDIFERTRENYVEEVKDKKLMEYALNGMLSSLDPHSGYMNQEEAQNMNIQTKGEFGGLGIEVTMDNGVVKVVSPIDDTPAQRAGMEAGDLIVEIDGEQVMGMSLSDAVDQMRGRVGTEIELTVIRKGAKKPLKFNITRAIIKIRSVKHRIEKDNVGYIRVTTFNAQTYPGLRKAFKEIKKKAKKKLVGYVLDLRNNPGGLLEQAIAVSDAFLEEGEIVSTRGRNENDTRRDSATPGDLSDGLPVVVLINAGSASASEIVAGAIQDHNRGVVMGTKSFGKGSVQTLFPVPEGGMIRLTTARYFTPSGNSIQATGITPDIVVEQAKLVKPERFFDDIHESDLKGALENPNGNGDDKKSKKKKKKKNKKNKKDDKKKNLEKDYQLLRAIDLIKGISLYNRVEVPKEAPKKKTKKVKKQQYN